MKEPRLDYRPPPPPPPPPIQRKCSVWHAPELWELIIAWCAREHKYMIRASARKIDGWQVRVWYMHMACRESLGELLRRGRLRLSKFVLEKIRKCPVNIECRWWLGGKKSGWQRVDGKSLYFRMDMRVFWGQGVCQIELRGKRIDTVFYVEKF